MEQTFMPIFERIKEIVDEAIKLKEHLIKEPINITLDYVAIFSKSNEEYDFYCESASKIGEIISESKNGITFKLNLDVITNDGSVRLIKIRKPDEARTQLGSPDYKVEDYEQFKNSYKNESWYKEVKSSDNVEMVEMSAEDFNVLIYFPSIALSTELEQASKTQTNEISELEKLKADLEAEKSRRLALLSDFQNHQRRIESEKATWGAMANLDLIKELLEAHDDLGLAMADEKLDLESSKSSIKSAQDKLVIAIKNAGIERVEVKVGDEFDREKMGAVSVIPAGEEMKNKVIAVITSAYKYSNNENVLKAAKVVVGK